MVPLHDTYFAKPLPINNREFVILLRSLQYYSLLKYDIMSDTYIEWKIVETKINFNDSSQCNDCSCITFCNDTIYLHLINGNVITYNIKLDCWTDYIVPNNVSYFIANTAEIVANKEIHIINGVGNQHLIWKSNDIGYQQIYEYEQLEQIQYLSEYSNANLIYIAKQNRLLLLGGYDEQTIGEAVDVIRSYNINKMTWSELHSFVPDGLYGFGCILTMDEKYILLFGGKYNTRWSSEYEEDTDHIYIIDTEKMIILKSIIRCPMKGDFYAFLSCDVVMSTFIVMGFVRRCWIQRKFKYHLRFPEMEVIQLIQCFYSLEMVHLFNKGNNKGYHWKLNVKDIINDINIKRVINLIAR